MRRTYALDEDDGGVLETLVCVGGFWVETVLVDVGVGSPGSAVFCPFSGAPMPVCLSGLFWCFCYDSVRS